MRVVCTGSVSLSCSSLRIQLHPWDPAPDAWALHTQAISGVGLYALRSVSGLQSLNLSSCLELGDDDPLAALVYLTGTAADA